MVRRAHHRLERMKWVLRALWEFCSYIFVPQWRPEIDCVMNKNISRVELITNYYDYGRKED